MPDQPGVAEWVAQPATALAVEVVGRRHQHLGTGGDLTRGRGIGVVHVRVHRRVGDRARLGRIDAVLG